MWGKLRREIYMSSTAWERCRETFGAPFRWRRCFAGFYWGGKVFSFPWERILAGESFYLKSGGSGGLLEKNNVYQLCEGWVLAIVCPTFTKLLLDDV